MLLITYKNCKNFVKKLILSSQFKFKIVTFPHLQCLHEGPCSGASDGTEIIDKIGLCHSDASIYNGQSVVFLVRDESDL